MNGSASASQHLCSLGVIKLYTLAFVEKTQSRELETWPVKMLEEEGFAVQRVD